MCGKFVQLFVAALIAGAMSSMEVNAQPTSVDESCGSSDSSTCVEAVELIRKGFGDVAKDLKDLKAQRQQSHQTECSNASSNSVLAANSLSANCIPLLIQQNINGTNFFNRSWAEFKVGFNDTRGNYWLGNELLSQLTQSDRYKLRFDLQAVNGS